jgi:16S rRNA processing protein RimM
VFTDFPERFTALRTVYLGDALQAQLWQVRQARWHSDRVLLSLEGCDDRTKAEQLRGLLVQIPVEEAMPLPEDEYYPHQLVGLDVVTREGEELGRLSEVVFTGANEIYVVASPRGQILLPAIADVIERVDLEEGYIVVNLIDGLI